MPERVSGMSRFRGLLKQLNPRRIAMGAVIGALLVTLSGCSGRPSRVEAPSWDPSGLTDNIFESLDKNADEKIDQEELAASPGLEAGAKLIDEDQDKALTRAELESRFKRYQALRVGVTSPSFVVTYRGRPVADATLDFIPEPWQDGAIESARGTTDVSGRTSPAILDPPQPGMRLGFYRVKVVAPNAKIPEKYAGEQSPLGANVSFGDPDSGYAINKLILTD
jgi:hypothetical protein